MTLNSQMEGALDERIIRASADSGSSVTLREKSANMRVKVAGLSDPFTAIRMGSGKGKLSHAPSLKDGPRKKICDYLLIAQIDGADHAVFVELKKSLGSRGDPEEQLLRSRSLLEYLLAVCDIERGGKNARPRISYVLVYEEIKLNKLSLRPDPNGKIDEIPYKSINIKRFQGTELELADLV